MVTFKTFIIEKKEDDYKELLDQIASLKTTVINNQLVYISKKDKTYTVIEIDGDNYVESEVENGKQELIKTNKLYKDGNITNYDLAISRLKDYINAVKNEQFITLQSKEKYKY